MRTSLTRFFQALSGALPWMSGFVMVEMYAARMMVVWPTGVLMLVVRRWDRKSMLAMPGYLYEREPALDKGGVKGLEIMVNDTRDTAVHDACELTIEGRACSARFLCSGRVVLALMGDLFAGDNVAALWGMRLGV